MYVIFKKSSPFKIRDINIAIAYHNTGRSLADVAREYKMAPQNVRGIHSSLVRHVARCMGLSDVWFHTKHKNHSDKIASYLQEYKNLLESGAMKTEITLNNENEQPALVLVSTNDKDFIEFRVVKDIIESSLISVNDLKHALRKLTTS